MSFRPFWMVLGNGTPSFKHLSEDAARKEAERLSRTNPGFEFFVLASVGRCVKSDVQWDQPDEDASYIPF